MSRSKHTPGPWKWVEIDPKDKDWGACEIATDDASDKMIARIVLGTANARLIAAAPDLLESARWALDFLRATKRDCPQNGAQDEAWVTFIRHLEKAIAKAEGRNP